ncbi:MAG: hypothetical protein WD021_06210 [Rhodothermales bacterium]
MKKLLTIGTLLITVAIMTGVSTPVAAQDVSLGADVVSRYVWRGTDFGESASIQPSLSFNSGGFEVGTWASYAVSPVSAGLNEHDIWVGYTAGPVSVGVTDYYFPAPGGSGFFDFDNGEGAHTLEPYVAFGGTETFPVSLFAGYLAYNDPDNSLYLNASVPFAVSGVDMSFGVGASAGESGWYGTDGFAIIDVALTGSKSIPITDSFELPVFVQYVLNPDAERTFLVFGVSL